MGRFLKMALLCLLLGLSGCVTDNPNTPGKIRDTGVLGTTVVEGVGNAESPATLNREENKFEIKHRNGDVLVIQAKTDEPPPPLEQIAQAITGKKDDSSNIPPVSVDAQGNLSNGKGKIEMDTSYNQGWTLTYYPTEGATTTFTGIKVDATTGHSREDTAAIVREQLKNTKTIQYVGIGLIIAGVLVLGLLKSPKEGGLLGLAGTGMIILQSTLANPLWSWICIGLLVLIPLVWLFNYFKHNSLNKRLVQGVEKFKLQHPECKDDIENALRGVMDQSHKSLVKEIKKSTPNA